MPDPYASIAQTDEALQARLADVLELRAADPQQRAMIDAYLSELELPNNASALEVGCGTGAVTRILATMPGVKEVSVFLRPTRDPLELASVIAGSRLFAGNQSVGWRKR